MTIDKPISNRGGTSAGAVGSGPGPGAGRPGTDGDGPGIGGGPGRAGGPGTAGGSGTGGGSTPVPGGRAEASPIEFRLDAASGVPTYLQLVQQVEHALRLGYLKPGDQLPKVRDVVASLTINPNTVLKAYKELETKGLTSGRPGQGTFIQAPRNRVALPERAALQRWLLRWLTAAEETGLDEDGIVALFTRA